MAEQEFTVETVHTPAETNEFHLYTMFESILSQLETFSQECDFQEYNTKVNLTLALITEVGELAELLQWRKDESRNKELDMLKRNKICMEIADVAIYTMRLAVVYSVVENVKNSLSRSAEKEEKYAETSAQSEVVI